MPQSRRPHAVRRISLALAALLAAGAAQAAAERFQDLSVEVVGKGRPVLMIPGLNSGAETWRETCAALQADKVQCHLIQLPGFAGAPAAEAKAEVFTDAMRDRLLAYIEQRKLKRAVVMGHSLGGFVALRMGMAAKPGAIDRLIIVDTLADMSAVMQPGAGPEAVRKGAEAMRAQMLGQDAEHYRRGIAAAVQGMTHDQARVQTLIRWGEASDRATTAQAMFEMMATDLRPQLQQVRVPTVVLASWAGYARFGATQDSTAALYRDQYAKLDGVRIELSKDGYHFLMWDDPQWLQEQVRGVLAARSAD
ncbi:alpha/beta hydrolase [Lysobacter enzymogenes]|uniref:alpha/beta fold hydrolase n=1 Tax=Lysobacter enzymogenes TaxID=69 RepID=UPI003749CDD2